MVAGKKIHQLWSRLKEPGSQRAIMFMAGIFNIPQVQVDNWLGVATLLMGIAAVLTPES